MACNNALLLLLLLLPLLLLLLLLLASLPTCVCPLGCCMSDAVHGLPQPTWQPRAGLIPLPLAVLIQPERREAC
jgi:hypothetical protein